MTSQRQRRNTDSWRRRISDRLREATTPMATAYVWWQELRRVARDPHDPVWTELERLLRQRARERGDRRAA
ncbi:hypothetical protein [Cryptosporangium phraense]|uniref:Uncharacterized protein n=1 Tax=Cryptosporangium phraense TaxID=2593070 RepID=A0A545ASM0_9ACTN|nr:hypothetical protein [Cryptosporangium phraense]TQS44337.1 hypothetical protein FL583_15505 [Cryptosporangium phraense]